MDSIFTKDGGREAVEREVLASKICRCFDCHQVLYEQGMFENEPVSISKIMTSQRYSLVTYAPMTSTARTVIGIRWIRS